MLILRKCAWALGKLTKWMHEKLTSRDCWRLFLGTLKPWTESSKHLMEKWQLSVGFTWIQRSQKTFTHWKTKSLKLFITKVNILTQCKYYEHSQKLIKIKEADHLEDSALQFIRASLAITLVTPGKYPWFTGSAALGLLPSKYKLGCTWAVQPST